MAQDSANATPSTSIGTADLANASAQVEMLSAVRRALSSGSDAVISVLSAILWGVTYCVLNGNTGANDKRLLRSKGTSGGTTVTKTGAGAGTYEVAGTLQPSAITCDDSGNLSGGTWQGTVVSPVYGGTGHANNAANVLTWSGNFAATFTLSNTTAVTFPTTGTLAVLTTNTWTQQQGFGTVTLTDAATITWNAQTQQVAKVTLGGNRTLGAPSNLVDGFTYVLRVIQDGTGTRTLAYNAVYKWPGGVAPVLSTAAGSIDVLTFVTDGTNMYGIAQLAFA